MNTVLQVVSAAAALASVGVGIWLGRKWAPRALASTRARCCGA